MRSEDKVPVTTRLPPRLVVLVRSACKEKRIRFETFYEQCTIAGLERLGYEVPPELLEEEDEVDVPGPRKGPSVKA